MGQRLEGAGEGTGIHLLFWPAQIWSIPPFVQSLLQREEQEMWNWNEAKWLPASLVFLPCRGPKAPRGWAIDQGHHLQHRQMQAAFCVCDFTSVIQCSAHELSWPLPLLIKWGSSVLCWSHSMPGILCGHSVPPACTDCSYIVPQLQICLTAQAVSSIITKSPALCWAFPSQM
jgi:hypothetical protein